MRRNAVTTTFCPRNCLYHFACAWHSGATHVFVCNSMSFGYLLNFRFLQFFFFSVVSLAHLQFHLNIFHKSNAHFLFRCWSFIASHRLVYILRIHCASEKIEEKFTCSFDLIAEKRMPLSIQTTRKCHLFEFLFFDFASWNYWPKPDVMCACITTAHLHLFFFYRMRKVDRNGEMEWVKRMSKWIRIPRRRKKQKKKCNCSFLLFGEMVDYSFMQTFNLLLDNLPSAPNAIEERTNERWTFKIKICFFLLLSANKFVEMMRTSTARQTRIC